MLQEFTDILKVAGVVAPLIGILFWLLGKRQELE